MRADTPSSQTLNGSTANVLRQKIMQGELLPGQRLSEASLSESLSISRNTLREAFRLLTQEGLLEHQPNRGVFVATPSVAALMDIYRVRRLIECQALQQAYPHHPAKKLVREAVEKAQHYQTQNDWHGVGTANMEFHQAIVQLADSERLNAMFAQLLAELRLAFTLLDAPELLHAPYVDLNSNILTLIENNQLSEAATALHDYLSHAERIVLSAYNRRLTHGKV